jgi:hypothetical protein
MKLTWFGATTMRIHVGGEVLVSDPVLAPGWVDAGELKAGADRSFDLAGDTAGLETIDGSIWQPRRPRRAIDQSPDRAGVRVLAIAPHCVLVDAVGEPPLVLMGGAEQPRFGRWSEDAVIVLFGADESMVASATVLLDVARPRLLALAADEATLDTAIAELREHLGGTALSSLEPGLALEV